MQTGFYRVTFSLLPEMPSHITELTKIVILECHFNCNKLQQFLLFTDSSYMTITAVKKKINNSIISSFYRQENWGTERRTRKLTVNIFLESKGLSSLFKFCFSLCFLTLSHRLHHTLFVLPSNSSANLALLYALSLTDSCSQAFSSAMCVCCKCHCQLWFSHGCLDQFCGHSLSVLCPFFKLCCLFIPYILKKFFFHSAIVSYWRQIWNITRFPQQFVLLLYCWDFVVWPW